MTSCFARRGAEPLALVGRTHHGPRRNGTRAQGFPGEGGVLVARARDAHPSLLTPPQWSTCVRLTTIVPRICVCVWCVFAPHVLACLSVFGVDGGTGIGARGGSLCRRPGPGRGSAVPALDRARHHAGGGPGLLPAAAAEAVGRAGTHLRRRGRLARELRAGVSHRPRLRTCSWGTVTHVAWRSARLLFCWWLTCTLAARGARNAAPCRFWLSRSAGT